MARVTVLVAAVEAPAAAASDTADGDGVTVTLARMLNVTGMVSAVVPLASVTVMVPEYEPVGLNTVGSTLTVRAVGVVKPVCETVRKLLVDVAVAVMNCEVLSAAVNVTVCDAGAVPPSLALNVSSVGEATMVPVLLVDGEM